MKEKDFLKLLEKEAFEQSIIEKNHLLPDRLGVFSSIFVKNTWKFLFIISGLLSIIKVGLIQK